jgi:hypothetical protein
MFIRKLSEKMLKITPTLALPHPRGENFLEERGG